MLGTNLVRVTLDIGSEENIFQGSEKSSLAREEVWRVDRNGAEAR